MFSGSRYLLAGIVLLFSSIWANAQTIEGTIYSKEEGKPVTYTTISNKRTKQVTYSDINGAFKIEGIFGDTLILSHPGYIFRLSTININTKNNRIYLEPQKHELEEVEILSDLAKFKKDSADKHTIYRKTLKDAGHAPSMSFNNGIAMDGLFTSLAFWISGKGKKNRKFTETLIYHEENKFIGLKYNPLVVSEQTNLSEEEAQQFMMEYPMPYDYARAATDLEIKMWIRTNYREWIKKPKTIDSIQNKPATNHK